MTASEQGVTTVKVKTAAVNVTWLASLVFSTLALWPSTALGQTGWSSADIGDVGTAGGAAETNGVWTVQGAGGDVWGTADAFHFVYRPARTDDMQILARVDDLQNTDPFAKAGVMLRSSLDPSAATVILDAKPNGEVEFMARLADGGQMSYLGGAFVTLPAWVRLSWQQPSSDSIVSALAWVSEDGVSWSQIGGGVGEVDFRYAGSNIYAGVAVTSHDTSQLNTAHVQSLSAFGSAHISTDVGATGLPGNVSEDPGGALMIQGAGADIWGPVDAFQFVHLRLATVFADVAYRVTSLDDTNPFAKAGLMFREDTSPGAMSVILDAKPSGEVEFMARLCTGCETTYLGGVIVTLPSYLELMRGEDGTTFTAKAGASASSVTVIGSVQVPMSTAAEFGWVVTSHDVSQLTTALLEFFSPPR
jgi:hypothetical protein